MSEASRPEEMLPAEAGPELETVLAAWHDATVRLEQTHESLRAEVRRLTDELEVKNRELARENRLADLGRMASHIAHEVRNNLVPVTLYLSLLRRRVAGDQGSIEVLEKIEAGFGAVESTVSDLLNFTTDRDPQWQTFPLAGLIEDVHAAVAPQLSAQSIQTQSEVDGSQQVTADRDMLRRALLNLVLNAVDAMPEGGTLSLASAVDEHGVAVEVADTGPGMTEDTARRAFEPFFTTKRGGTGLGLAIVHRVAEAHGGQVFGINRAEGGAAFRLQLPQPAKEAAA
jgi:signal transduction histidine kinase